MQTSCPCLTGVAEINKTNLAVGKESNLYPPHGKTIAVTFWTLICNFQTDCLYFSVYYILNWDVNFNERKVKLSPLF